MPIPEPGRLAGHALLDAVTGYDRDAPATMNSAAIGVAIERLTELNLIKVTSDEQGRTHVEMGSLAGPAVILLIHAVKLASQDGRSPELVVAELRAMLDSL